MATHFLAQVMVIEEGDFELSNLFIETMDNFGMGFSLDHPFQVGETLYFEWADVKVLYQGTLAECEQFMDDLDEPYIGNTYLLGGE